MIGVVFTSELTEQVDQPLGGIRLLLEDVGTQSEDESQGSEGMSQAKVLGVAVGFFDAVGSVLAVRRVHSFGGDQQLWSGCPVSHDDVDLFEVVLAQDVGAGRGDSGNGRAPRQSGVELRAFLRGDGFEEVGDGHRQDTGMSAARPGCVSIKACATEFVAQPHVEG
ncbi:hypothetical protein HMPREF3086_03395 [Dietzia sp. HMSC21D01]|nr:hypothetical protein HMPREF3086_03395 [Dietzia sp. HMSC21D01]